MTLTRQEAAQALIDSGLDVPSLEAILGAVRSIGGTGYGTITLRIEKKQVVNWKYETTGVVDRKKIDG